MKVTTEHHGNFRVLLVTFKARYPIASLFDLQYCALMATPSTRIQTVQYRSNH